jgi:hypothetical protein
MSALKTPDHATLPEHVGSPGHELRRQEARGRRLDADFRRALKSRKGSSRAITCLADRGKHAIPHGDAMDNLDDYPDLNSRRGRGRQRGFRMSDEHRGKIRNSSILNALIEHFEGKREMSDIQVRVGLGLLKKVLPDLRPVTPEFSSCIARKSCRRSPGMQTDRVREPWA